MPQYEKYPTSSNQVEGRTFDLFKSKNKRKPVHKYAKKTAKKLISEPVIEYGFVPIKDEPNLFHKEYYTVGANEMKKYILDINVKVIYIIYYYVVSVRLLSLYFRISYNFGHKEIIGFFFE